MYALRHGVNFVCEADKQTTVQQHLIRALKLILLFPSEH